MTERIIYDIFTPVLPLIAKHIITSNILSSVHYTYMYNAFYVLVILYNVCLISHISWMLSNRIQFLFMCILFALVTYNT